LTKPHIERLEGRIHSLEPKPKPTAQEERERWDRLVAKLSPGEQLQVARAIKLYESKRVEDMTTPEKDQLYEAIRLVERAEKS
jgi:hypothetical protein